MKPDYKDALVLALDRGIAEPTGKWSMFNGVALHGLEDEWKQVLSCEQGSRPEFLKLQQSGCSVVAKFEEDAECTGSIVLAGRNRKVNEANIIRA